MFALLIRLPGPIEKYAEHSDMELAMKEQVATLESLLSQLLILLQWFAAYFPGHFYLGAPGILDRKYSPSPSRGEGQNRKPNDTDEAGVQYRSRDNQAAEDSFGIYNLSGLPGSEEISEEEFNQLVGEMYPVESCPDQPLGLTDSNVKLEAEATAEKGGQDMKTEEQAHSRDRRAIGRLDEEDGRKTAIDAKWERLQRKHDFPGDLYKVFHRFVPQFGAQETDRLLQLAMALFLPDTLLKIKKHIGSLRKLQTVIGETLPTWICRTATQCCRGYRPNHFSVRLLQWSVYQYIKAQRSLWDPASRRNQGREHIINTIALSGLTDVDSSARDHGSPSLDQVKRKIQSWHDQGREWDSIVQAAGSGSVLIYLPDKPAQNSASPAVSATKYRNLTKEQAFCVIAMARETWQPPDTLFKDEDLLESFLFRYPPRNRYRLEFWPDNQICQEQVERSAFDYLGTI